MGKGKLLFKGDKPKKKKSKSKSKHHSKKEDESSFSTVVPPPSSSSSNGPSATAASTTKEPSSSSSTLPTVRTGTGRITTSGTVVTGHDGTKFEKELANGDAILVTTANNGNGTEELRVITMRLSNISLNLSSPFSVNLSTPTTFQYIRQPRNVTQELQRKQRQELETANEREQHAYDLYKSNTTTTNGSTSTSTSTTSEYVYREKTETGSYRIKKENVKTTKGGQVSRGELLELRAKKSTDKYCF